MKTIFKVILGWILIVATIFFVYGMGKFRQHLEYKFNNGNEFNVLFPNSIFGRQIAIPIDNGTFSVMVDGIGTIFTALFAVAFILAMSVIAYRIGEDVLDRILKESK